LTCSIRSRFDFNKLVFLIYLLIPKSELKSHVNVVAYDFRGHGATHTAERDEDFSGETLSTDSQKIITDIIKEDVEKLKSDETPRLIIVGHSMGGAIAAKTALLMDKLWMRGLILVDIVEGTAIAALPSMQRIISSRPSSFKSVSDAILWSCKARLVQNSYSARISVPSQIIESPNASGDGTTWKWRTNLSSTEPYWKGASFPINESNSYT
jgi:protein phosphatase methylesterase 1